MNCFDLADVPTDRRSWMRVAPSAWLIFWPSGFGIDYHDHGDSWARFWVISGVLTESIPTWGGYFVSYIDNGAGVQERVPHTLHRVVNNGDVMAVSVHSYDPNLTVTYSDSMEIRPERNA